MTEAKTNVPTLPINQILCGDCINIMKTFPADSIDMTEYSPPYWGLRDYGVQGQIGLEAHPTKYIEKMVQLCQEIRRILKKTGSMYVVIGDTYFGGNGTYGKPKDWQDLHMHQNYPSGDFYKERNKLASNWLQSKQLMGIPWRVAIALQEDGWILRNDIIWYKPNHMPSSVKDRLTQAYEHIFHFVKNRKYYYNLDAIREPHKTEFAPFNLRVRDVKRGKGGVSAFGKLKATKEEIENYAYPEKALKKGKQYRRRDSKFQLTPTDAPNRSSTDVPGRYEGKFAGFGKESEKFGSPRARTQRFQTQKEPYIKNNPHLMRLEPEKHIALDPSAPMDLSHPLGKNPSDILKFKGDETKNAGRLARSRERYREQGLFEGHPLGMNPSDFWEITTKPYKGAHFAVYPEAVCVKPIKSSCPANGIVLDPMCGSGTTLVVAKKLGRQYIGIELNPKYVDMARKRLAEIL